MCRASGAASARRGADRGDPPVAVSAAPPFRRGRARRARPIDPRERHSPAAAGAPVARRGEPTTSWSPASGAGARRSAPVCTRCRSSVRELADREALEIALVENIQREDLSPLEEAEAYSRLIGGFGRNQGALAEAVGKSRSHVANTIRLLALPEPVRRRSTRAALTGPRAGPAWRCRPGGARRRGRAARSQRPRDRAAGAPPRRYAAGAQRRASVTPTPWCSSASSALISASGCRCRRVPAAGR